MFALVSSLLVALAIDVPFLPQSEALCGGAAVSMVFRYWGDTHADPQQFATLVDRRAGGIAAGALVEAVERRGWRAIPFAGSSDRLRDEVGRGRPVVILIEDRPGRYHFVVVTGVTDDGVTVHDPASGPSRTLLTTELLAAWAPTGFWSLLILPGEHTPARAAPASIAGLPPAGAPSMCDRLLADAVEQVRRRGFDAADDVLGPVRAACPASPGPLHELAGVRFAQRRWNEAEALAEQALAIDPADAYAWEILASSRYVRNDLAGALAAWNRIGRPRVDAVRIEGLERTRYAVVADALALEPGALLTVDRFRRAGRRLDEWPARSASRLAFQPLADGYAVVDATIVERAARPRGVAGWAAIAARTASTRELSAAVPGTTGQGELWRASWRWWRDRPRVAVGFAAPRVGGLPGTWRFEGAWEAQAYATGRGPGAPRVRESSTRGAVSVSDWLTGDLRYELAGGVESWDGTRRHVNARGTLERRWLRDRIALSARATAGVPLGTAAAYRVAGLRARVRSSIEAAGTVWLVDAGLTTVSRSAPLALWPGAGDGQAREVLLRAHALLRGGTIDSPMFGRQLASASVERQRWFTSRLPARIGVAAFTDVARVWHPFAAASSRAWQADAGAGLRVKVPGIDGTLRIDVAQGLRDRARAVTFGLVL